MALKTGLKGGTHKNFLKGAPFKRHFPPHCVTKREGAKNLGPWAYILYASLMGIVVYQKRARIKTGFLWRGRLYSGVLQRTNDPGGLNLLQWVRAPM